MIDSDVSCVFNVYAPFSFLRNAGHYIALVKSHSHWLLFDDDVVTPIDESEVTGYFGMSRENDVANTDHGYILMYNKV